MRCTLTPVGAAPQVSDVLVDLIHLHAVELHDGSVEATETLMTFTRFLSHTDDQATTCSKLTDLEPLHRVSGLC